MTFMSKIFHEVFFLLLLMRHGSAYRRGVVAAQSPIQLQPIVRPTWNTFVTGVVTGIVLSALTFLLWVLQF